MTGCTLVPGDFAVIVPDRLSSSPSRPRELFSLCLWSKPICDPSIHASNMIGSLNLGRCGRVLAVVTSSYADGSSGTDVMLLSNGRFGWVPSGYLKRADE